jgi:hypothetical protein
MNLEIAGAKGQTWAGAGAAATARRPSFFIIGAPKAGTTTLYEYLWRHPGLFMCEPKEPCFFSDESVWGRGWDWYRSLFSGATDDQLCGEASTGYTRWPHTSDAPARIAATYPDAKLIYILRHPVERAYSHYAHHMRYGVTMTFEEALQRNAIYVDCSLYMNQLDRYLRFFARNQLQLLLFDELTTDPADMLRRIQEFIGVRPMDLIGDGVVVANTGGARLLLSERLGRVFTRVGSMPGMPLVKQMVPKSWRTKLFFMVSNSPVGKLLVYDYRLPPMKPETRTMLLRRFEAETQRLEVFLGRELPSWHR